MVHVLHSGLRCFFAFQYYDYVYTNRTCFFGVFPSLFSHLLDFLYGVLNSVKKLSDRINVCFCLFLTNVKFLFKCVCVCEN